MAEREARLTPPAEVSGRQGVAELLGGLAILGHVVTSPLEAHDMLLEGLPGRALSHLLDRLVVLQKNASLEKAIGMSLRTFQRRKEAPLKPLSQEQSARTWKFAEILALATSVFGSQDEAERWLDRPAMGLDNRRPINLLATPAGAECVENFLWQIKYGVYV
jgi:putative toxin-antitoxin system antitoxin component (TIGR02293 family)